MIYFSAFFKYSNKFEKKQNSMSAPCYICLKRLQCFGFGKIAFSNEKGEIQCVVIRFSALLPY